MGQKRLRHPVLRLEALKTGDWLRCAKHPKGRQAMVPVPFFRVSYVRAYLNDALWLEWGPPHCEVPIERFQVNALTIRARSRCDVSTQDMKPWGSGLWSHGKQLFCRAEQEGLVAVEFHVKKAGR